MLTLKIKSMLEFLVTIWSPVPVPGWSTLYRTPELSFVIGLEIRSSSIFRSPISRHDSMSVHLADAGRGRRSNVNVFSSDLLELEMLVISLFEIFNAWDFLVVLWIRDVKEYDFLRVRVDRIKKMRRHGSNLYGRVM